MASDARPAREDVEDRILHFMQRELLGPGVTITRDADLLSGAVLDSLSVLRLAAFVSDEFRIVIQPSDFTVEHFRTAAAIAGYVRQALDARAPGPSAQ